MNKILLGSLVATVVLSLGIIFALIEPINNQPEPIITVIEKPVKWYVTCNPTYEVVLTYEHFGYQPLPDILGNLTLTNEFGVTYMLYNMNNCDIMKATAPVTLQQQSAPQIESQSNSIQEPPPGTTV